MTQPARPTHWWHAVDRRTFNKGALAFTALLSLSGCKSEQEQAADSLKLQQEQGWNVGAKESRLFFTSTTEKDATDSQDWRRYTNPTDLIAAWQPRTEAWRTFFTPTLMQSLKDESLRAQMRLILNQGMREAFARGETLRRDLLSQVDKGAETFFIADLPGPEAVAFGAAMAGWADLLPGFENWPHPHGVVRSHDTLAALLYYAASVQEQKKQLPESAPGLLLLDSQRLAPYADADNQFDNRYMATLPSATALKERNVKNIMYIVPSRAQKEESDDLNDDFSYELVRPLGRGGMATVYLAHDHKHHRDVAIKVLDPELAAAVGPERFLREIEIAAALHHPHILPLYDSGITDGLLYYAMPYVAGESLRQRLARESHLRIADALRIAHEVAGALDYAHRQGVVHRDIKPENILLQDGQAIVADFGIARAIDVAGGERLTQPGPGIGTPAYMSPEQASSDTAIDGRTDIYALGCVLYEMLAGQPPFTGRSAQQVLARHAVDPVPSLHTVRGTVPPAVERAVTCALAKLPADRFATAAQFGRALATPDAEPVVERTPQPPVSGSAVSRARLGPWALAVGLLSVAVVAVIAIRDGGTTEVRLGRRAPVTLERGLEIDPAISPDGRSLAYAAGPMAELRLYIRQLASGTTIPLAPDLEAPQRFPLWSPDGRRILFRSARGIEVIPAVGGVPRLVIGEQSAPVRPAPSQGWGSGSALMPGAWSPDSREFAFVRSESLYVAALEGGASRPVAEGGELHSPAWSPDGHTIAYVTGNRQSLDPGVYFGNVGESTIWLVRATGGESVRVTDDRSSNASPTWLPRGRALLFVSNREGGRDVYLVALSRSGTPASTPTRLTTGLNAQAISLSADGQRLAYSVFSESSNIWTLPIPAGAPVSVSQARPVTAGNQVIEGFDLSPDARWLAFDTDRSGNPDIYRVPVAGGDPERLTTDPGGDFGPMWSPDGRELAFHSFRLGVRQIFVMSPDGRQRVQVTRDNDDARSPVWARDGQAIIFFHNFNQPDKELRVVSRDQRGRWGQPRTLLRTDALQVAVSPDGKQLAFTSASGLTLMSTTGESPRILVPVSEPSAQLRPRYVSWSSDGREVYYLALDPLDRASIWSVALSGGTRRLLVRFDDITREWHRYGFRARGGRFYFTVGDRQSDIWTAEVELPGSRSGRGRGVPP